MTNDDIVSALLIEEGVTFTDDPRDAGGPTKYGITQRTLAWARGHEVSVQDVQDLGEEEARAIYLRLYILGPHFDQVQDLRLRWQLADFGVNSGPHLAVQKLQDILHLPVDGVLGPQTLARVNEHPDPTALGNLLAKARVMMLVGLSVRDHSPYWKGWLRRALKFIAPLVAVTLLTGCGGKKPLHAIQVYPIFIPAPLGPEKYDLPDDGTLICTPSMPDQICVPTEMIRSMLLGWKKAH